MECFNCKAKLEKGKTWTVQLETAEGPHRVKLCEPCGKNFNEIAKDLQEVLDERI